MGNLLVLWGRFYWCIPMVKADGTILLKVKVEISSWPGWLVFYWEEFTFVYGLLGVMGFIWVCFIVGGVEGYVLGKV